MKIRKLLKSMIIFVLAGVAALSMAACGLTSIGGNASNDSGKITLVWYPNESASDYQSARDEFAKLITQATGKEVEHKLTTDYSIAIEAVAGGTAQICFMGAQGYIEANEKSKDVKPLFVNSGASGTLDDALYYSWLLDHHQSCPGSEIPGKASQYPDQAFRNGVPFGGGHRGGGNMRVFLQPVGFPDDKSKFLSCRNGPNGSRVFPECAGCGMGDPSHVFLRAKYTHRFFRTVFHHLRNADPDFYRNRRRGQRGLRGSTPCRRGDLYADGVPGDRSVLPVGDPYLDIVHDRNKHTLLHADRHPDGNRHRISV